MVLWARALCPFHRMSILVLYTSLDENYNYEDTVLGDTIHTVLPCMRDGVWCLIDDLGGGTNVLYVDCPLRIVPLSQFP